MPAILVGVQEGVTLEGVKGLGGGKTRGIAGKGVFASMLSSFHTHHNQRSLVSAVRVDYLHAVNILTVMQVFRVKEITFTANCG